MTFIAHRLSTFRRFLHANSRLSRSCRAPDIDIFLTMRTEFVGLRLGMLGLLLANRTLLLPIRWRRRWVTRNTSYAGNVCTGPFARDRGCVGASVEMSYAMMTFFSCPKSSESMMMTSISRQMCRLWSSPLCIMAEFVRFLYLVGSRSSCSSERPALEVKA